MGRPKVGTYTYDVTRRVTGSSGTIGTTNSGPEELDVLLDSSSAGESVFTLVQRASDPDEPVYETTLRWSLRRVDEIRARTRFPNGNEQDCNFAARLIAKYRFPMHVGDSWEQDARCENLWLRFGTRIEREQRMMVDSAHQSVHGYVIEREIMIHDPNNGSYATTQIEWFAVNFGLVLRSETAENRPGATVTIRALRSLSPRP